MASPTSAGKSRKPFLFVLGGLVLLFVLVYKFVLTPGEEPTKAQPTRPVAASKAPTSTTKPGPANQAGGAVVETFEIIEVKNPFAPLVPQAGGGSTGGTAGAPAPPTSPANTPATTPAGAPEPPSTGAGPEPGSTAPSQGPGGGSGSGGAVEPNVGTRVAMLEAPFMDGGRMVVNVKIGSTVYKVGVGDTFATSFKVVSLDGSCGVFLFGDNRFTLCSGQEILK